VAGLRVLHLFQDQFPKGLDNNYQQKESYYTSIRYLVKPRHDEIQVRTLFEEIWGGIDHTIYYPHPFDEQFSQTRDFSRELENFG
jgi:ppGpp synthetase/RelA/SpoT-type nucleotidyltranferase